MILGATLLAYARSLNGGLLWDDDQHLTGPALRSLHGLWRIWFDLGATQQYYPLLHSAFWLEHRLWGDTLPAYHLLNVLLHTVAACLVVAIVRRLGLPGAWLAGLLFALHPVCVESVAWIAEQKNTLSAVFYLSAALVYLHFDNDRRRRQYLLALALFVLALLVKTVTATLPAALLVVLWWKRGRLAWRRDALPLLPWLVLGASAGVFSAWVERRFIGAEGAEFALTFLQRGLLACRAICFYLGKLLWPQNLAFIYPRWTIDPGQVWQYVFVVAVLVLFAAAWLASRSRRGPLAALLLFVGTLFPALGFLNVFPFVFSYVADHFQYLATLGLIVPFAAVLTRLAGRVRRAPWLVPVTGAVLATILGGLTWRQASMYRSAETLYRETLRRNPACWLAHNNLGNLLAATPQGRAEAVAHLEAALALKPDFALAHLNLGIVLAELPDRRPEAITHFEAALRLRPDFAEAHDSLANALVHLPGRLQSAVSHYEQALRIDSEYPEAHNNLGLALSSVPERRSEAIVHFEEALRLRPDYAEAHNNLANALCSQPDRLQEAITHYEAALRLKPDYPEAHNNLGLALAGLPARTTEAIEHFEATLTIRPDWPEAHNNLANVLSGQPGRLPEAIAHYDAALRLKADYPEAHNNLANVLSGQPGRLPEAIAHYEAALRLRPDYAEAHGNLANALAQVPGRWAEAISHYEAALRLRPADPDVHFNAAITLLRTPARSREALAHIEATLRVRPDFAPARELRDRLLAARR